MIRGCRDARGCWHPLFHHNVTIYGPDAPVWGKQWEVGANATTIDVALPLSRCLGATVGLLSVKAAQLLSTHVILPCASA